MACTKRTQIHFKTHVYSRTFGLRTFRGVTSLWDGALSVRRDDTAADGREGRMGNARSVNGTGGRCRAGRPRRWRAGSVPTGVSSTAAVRGRGRVAHGAGHGGAGGREEHAEVDVADEVERGQQVHGHAVGDHPQVAERVRLDVAGEDERLVVAVDHGQVAGRVRQPRVPAAHGVPVDQVEVQHAVVVHVVRGHVAAGAARLEHAEFVVHVVRLDVGTAQVPGGHGELAVAGQRMEEQHAVPVVGHGRQRDAEHALLAPLEVDACNARALSTARGHGNVRFSPNRTGPIPTETARLAHPR